jgi:hypothetical protein
MTAETKDETTTPEEELRLLTTRILEMLGNVDSDGRKRIFETVGTFFALIPTVSASYPDVGQPKSVSTGVEQVGSFSDDRSMPPKQFIFEKKPTTDVEKVACLAYYLTHYLDTPHFKTLDISKLNTEAAQIKFSNAAVAVDNATKLNYLVPATKGNKQLSAIGEQFVRALPDRDKAKAVMANARPRRRSRRSVPTTFTTET